MERTRKRRELGFHCLTQFYQAKAQPSATKPLLFEEAQEVKIPPPAVTIREERRLIHLRKGDNPQPIEIGSPYSIHTARYSHISHYSH